MDNQNVSQALQKARAYEKEAGSKIPKEQKPSFHVSAPTGWINDPNGFSLFQGEYHLFYQYYPYAPKWGPMHWGHSKTRDFVKWEQLPAALAPDREYDGQGCFSGSALEADGRHILMYTSVLEKTAEDGGRLLRQTQSIAIGDGLNYEKIEANPVITGDMLPKGSSIEDFRDPKIWRDNRDGKFYAIIGSRHEDTSGQLVLFSSQNITDWKLEGVVERCHREYGSMWECPDFFELDGKKVILTSPQDMLAKEPEFHNGNNTMYLVGEYQEETVEFKREKAAAIDYGLDFYAPQTVETADGRRVMIGWMQSWDNYLPPSEFTWSGMMSIPRELRVRDNCLIQNPVRELEQYRQNPVSYQNLVIEENSGRDKNGGDKNEINGIKGIELEGVRGRQIDMTIEVQGDEASSLEISLACGESFKTMLLYEAGEGTLTFDREYAGIGRDLLHRRTMHVKHTEGRIKLRILMDRYTVEVFVNDGEQAMSSLIYTPLEADGIRFYSKEKIMLHLTKYDIVL